MIIFPIVIWEDTASETISHFKRNFEDVENLNRFFFLSQNRSKGEGVVSFNIKDH